MTDGELTDEELLGLVAEHPGLEAWELHSLARRDLGWADWSPALAGRLRALRWRGELRFEAHDGRVLWFRRAEA